MANPKPIKLTQVDEAAYEGDRDPQPFVVVGSIPGGGAGGGAVNSVNGKTGTVVLSASDVGAATKAQGDKADAAAPLADMQVALSSIIDSVGTKVTSTGGTVGGVWLGTQAEYDAIATKDPKTIYVTKG